MKIFWGLEGLALVDFASGGGPFLVETPALEEEVFTIREALFGGGAAE